MSLYIDVTELLYSCCYGKPKVEVGFPRNFEVSKVNLTAFERNLKLVLRKYDIKRKAAPPKKAAIKEVGGGSDNPL